MGFFGGAADATGLEHRVARLENQVRELTRLVNSLTTDSAPGSWPAMPAGQPLSDQPDWLFEVKALAARGKKLEAIKLTREATGLGLKEAKEYVERL